jgi:hypothetical protein
VYGPDDNTVILRTAINIIKSAALRSTPHTSCIFLATAFFANKENSKIKEMELPKSSFLFLKFSWLSPSEAKGKCAKVDKVKLSVYWNVKIIGEHVNVNLLIGKPLFWREFSRKVLIVNTFVVLFYSRLS